MGTVAPRGIGVADIAGAPTREWAGEAKHLTAMSLPSLHFRVRSRGLSASSFVVDACRTDLGERGDTDLPLPPAPAGSIVLFATSPGATASDAAAAAAGAGAEAEDGAEAAAAGATAKKDLMSRQVRSRLC